ncbi:HK97 gp10 family phage protein [Methanoculleus sp.]|uniref:HK97 gp10 family phage protein n=1 Tax=Methanoculleus sp. TaxID=90427 RepID=UPI0025E31A5D|nr:HK97 gp10 family phage protein [Methanoculleus sp.]MCK9318895.1 hypothetical protein [Methanoculleus sp.]
MYQIEIKGFAEFNRNLEKAGGDLEKQLGTAISKSISLISRNAKTKTPVRTGNLIKGYRTKYGKLEGVLANIVKYAPYVEYGSSKHRVSFTGRFYLKKGVEQSMGGINEFFSRALKDVVVRISNL